MAHYLLIESRDPFESNDVELLLRLGQRANRRRQRGNVVPGSKRSTVGAPVGAVGCARARWRGVA